VKVKNIIKRDGDCVEFDQERIFQALLKASNATAEKVKDLMGHPEEIARQVLPDIMDELNQNYGNSPRLPTVENVQDVVEHKLVENGFFEVARNYIIYRADHAQQRAHRRIEELRKLEKNRLKIVKHSGKSEVFDRAKIKKTFERAAQGYEDVCAFEEVYAVFKNTLAEGIPTAQIMRNLRRVCLDMITTKNIAWQHVAGRLYAMEFYKKAMRSRGLSFEGIYTPQSFKDHMDDYIERGLYYKDFYQYYSPGEILQAGSWLDRQRDFSYIYSTMLAFDRRYLLNPNKQFRELPQEMYLAVALFLAIPEAKAERMSVAQKIYEATSSQQLSLPTPTLLNARTNYHQLSSCFKLNVADDLRVIYHNIENMAQISKFGGGVGVYLGHVRSRGAAIRGVEGSSGGVIPWTRIINDTACAVNQLGARLGAISPTLDIWHRDIHDFLNLQTETGDIRSKAFDIFPAVSIPDLFMRRVQDPAASWTLFDPHEIETVTGQRLEDCFNEDFETFYEACEQDERLKLKDTVNARDLMKAFLKTVVETGMPYTFFRDTVNRANPNRHAGHVYSTQLCTEICQNTRDARFVGEHTLDGQVHVVYEPGEAVVCNLASINIAKVHTPEQMDAVVPVAMRVLDNVITLNFYPIQEARLTAQRYRSVGLGFMGLAEYLACAGLRYDSGEARAHVDDLFERYALSVLNASHTLARERGAYELFEGSDWHRGIVFGRDAVWYDQQSRYPDQWRDLRERIQKDGVRFAYHMAPAPNTSTSGVVGTTAGLLPVYKKFFVETNAIAPIVTVAPNLAAENFWHYKEYVNMNMNDVIDMIAVIYKWIDQSISFEWMLNPAETSPRQLFDYYIRAWEAGIKTVYYLRSMSGEVKETCESCSG